MATKGTIGGKIVLEGEQQYRNALKNIKSAQAELRSEMKLSQSQFKGSANSLTALTSKQEILTKQVETSQKKVDVYSKAVADSTKKQEEAKAKLDALLASQEASDEEIKKAQKDYDAITNKVNSYKTSLNYAEVELNKYQSELDDTNKYLDEASNSMDGCARSIDEFGDEVDDAKDKTGVFGDVLKANLTSEAIISGVKLISKGIANVASAAIETGMEFESSMSKVAALSGATGRELEDLTAKAKEMGASTMFSASEAADALGYMALAGWDTKSMLAGLEPVLNLAAAADMDLAEASDIVTDNLTAFGLSAKDTRKFTDQMAYAMSNSNTNVTQLGEAYKNCASTATSMGFAVEDVTAVLMTMANAGVKGGEAGNGLSTIMTRLATNTKGCADQLKGYGIEVYDAQGNMNSLASILQGMSGIWSQLSDAEQASLAKTIAGTQQYSKLQTIMMGLSDSAVEGGQSFMDYAEALANCDGSAQQMAETMQDNLKGKLTILQSALDALKVSTYEAFDDALKGGVEEATIAVDSLNRSVGSGKLNVSLRKMSDALGSFMTGAIKLGEKALPVVIDGLSWILNNADTIAVGIGGMVTAQAAIGIVTGIKTAIASWQAYKVANEGATVAQWLLNAAMEANPVGGLVTGITAAVGAITALTYWLVTYKGDTDEATESANRLIEAQKNSNQVTQDNIKSRKENREEMEASEKVTNDLIDRLDELNNKTSLTTSEQAEMRSIVSQLNSSYPELNLQIDQNGKLIGKTTSEIKSQCKAYLELGRVQAAQDDLTNISSEIYEKEKERTKIAEQMLELEKDIQQQTGMTAQEYSTYASSLGDANAALAIQKTTSGQALVAWRELQAQYDETGNALDDLNGEYETAYQFVVDNIGAADGATEAYVELESQIGTTAEAYSDLSAASLQSMSALADTVSESVENSLDAFSRFNKGVSVSKDELIANLQSQIEGVQGWSTNMQELAKRGVSEGLLQELAKMGPEGYTYVEAFLTMTDEELADYDQKFQEYVSIPDTVSAEIASSYGDSAKEATDAYEDEIAKGAPGVKTEAQKMADNAMKAVKNTMSVQAGKDIAGNVVAGLVSGLGSGEGSVGGAAGRVASSAVEAMKKKLDIHSPSRVFKELGEFSGQGYIIGLEDSMADIDGVVENALPDISRIANDKSGALSDINVADSALSLSLDSAGIERAVAIGASNANISLSIGTRELTRTLKEMGVQFTS